MGAVFCQFTCSFGKFWLRFVVHHSSIQLFVAPATATATTIPPWYRIIKNIGYTPRSENEFEVNWTKMRVNKTKQSTAQKRKRQSNWKEQTSNGGKNDYLSFNLFVCKYIYILIRTCRKTSLQINRKMMAQLVSWHTNFHFFFSLSLSLSFDFRSFHSIKDHIVP